MNTEQYANAAGAVGSRFSKKSRKGFTLLELVVVLTVLVALAGILLPTLPNLLQKSHVAVCSTNIPGMNKAMLTYGTLQFQQPNQFDNLVDASGDLDGLPDGGVDYAGSLDVGNLTADEVDALNDVGISTIVIADWDENPTFGAHTTAPVVLDDTTDVLIASAAHVQDVLNVGTGALERFVVFGVGQQTTLVGELNGGIFEAPVHFSDEAGLNPSQAYSRYVVVYQVADAAGNALSEARFVGASALHDDGLENVNEHIEEFYN